MLVAFWSTSPEMTIVFYARSNGRFIEIRSKPRRKKLHRNFQKTLEPRIRDLGPQNPGLRTLGPRTLDPGPRTQYPGPICLYIYIYILICFKILLKLLNVKKNSSIETYYSMYSVSLIIFEKHLLLLDFKIKR